MPAARTPGFCDQQALGRALRSSSKLRLSEGHLPFLPLQLHGYLASSREASLIHV